MKTRLALALRSRLLCTPIILAATFSLLGTFCLAQDSVYTLPITDRAPMPGSTVSAPLYESFILTTPLTSPTAVLILLPGDEGEIQLTPASLTVSPSDGTLDINSNNFLVRSRWLLASNSFAVISLDAATDFYGLPNGLKYQQGSPQHVADLLQVVNWAQMKYAGLPVWIVGTSRGTGGAWLAAQYGPLAGGPNGLVFADPVNIVGDPDSLLIPIGTAPALNLAAITVPTLIVQDTVAACPVSLPAQNYIVKGQMTAAPTVNVVNFGLPGLPALQSNPCHPLTAHGFFGIEELVLEVASAWIKGY